MLRPSARSVPRRASPTDVCDGLVLIRFCRRWGLDSAALDTGWQLQTGCRRKRARHRAQFDGAEVVVVEHQRAA
jgi:hypothetical protein